MDNIFHLIHVNAFDELNEIVFNKKLSANCFRGYASCLSSEEEKFLIQKFVETKGENWFAFIKKYIGHFPLSSDAVLLLLENSANSEIKTLLEEEWKKYGACEKESLAFCDRLHGPNEIDENLLAVFCDSARLAYDDAAYKLSLIDSKWSERYINASKRYMQNTH